MATKTKKTNATDDFRERAALDQPPAWKPEPGAVLVGTIEGYTTGRSKHPKLPDTYPIALVRDEDTDEVVSVHIVLTAIRNQFQRENPEVGERIAIKYNGERVSAKTDAKYHDYRLSVDRPDDAVNATSFADAAPEIDPHTEADAE